MNKKKIVFIVVIILLVLLLPIRVVYMDGGTKTYTALLYKIIVWNEIDFNEESGYKKGTEIYFFPNNFHSLNYYKIPSPSALFISSGEETIICNLGTYSWKEKVDGKDIGVAVDKIHPVEMMYKKTLSANKDSKIHLENEELNITRVEMYPEGIIEALEYNITYDNIEKEITIPSIKEGIYILVIHTKCEQGDAVYSFKLEVI